MNGGAASDWPAPEVAVAPAVRSCDPQGEPGWRILVVDSDAGVHAAMRAALQGRTLFGRALVPRHACSGDAARVLLMDEPNVAMVLLDVASEPVGGTGAAAGNALALVDFIRHTARLPNARIVLRTGQPGPVTDLDTLLQYDINDYRPKSELTHDRLLALVVTSVRSYQRLCAAEASRRSLELIVRSSASLLETTDPRAFASGVITQLAALLGVACHALVCTQHGEPANGFQVLAAAGRFAGLVDGPFDAVAARPEWDVLRRVLESRGNVYAADGGVALYIGHQGRQGMAVFIDVPAARGALDTQMLDVFCANLGTLLHNHGLLARLHEYAYYDPLVRLPNRAHFVEKVDECARLGTRGHVLALLDIDDFSATNDVMGHRFGDCLLERVARALSAALPPGVLLARLGADTFGVLGAAAQVPLQRLLDCVRQPLAVNGVAQKVSLTCGYVFLPEVPQAGADLVKDATIALKRAKRDHRGQHLQYSDHMGAEARTRALLLSDLRAAIDTAKLFLVYQPQIDLATRRLVGLEALVRWRADDGQLISPDQFIPVAEHSGLIVALGKWVLSTACACMRELLDAGHAPGRMAVNVSSVQLQDPAFFDTVCAALADSGLEGPQLELEITESVAALPTQLLNSTLSRLRAQGISIAIDDFGTGYSSLSYLERLALDRIKIDRSFVRHLGEPHGVRIAEMVAQLGRKLGLQVLAEGIEDAAALRALLDMGCHEGQGYHIAMPMEKGALVAWLHQHA